MRSKKIVGTALCLAASMMVGSTAMAATAHYFDGTTAGDEWTAWLDEWKTVSKDFTKVALTIGADETQLNFAWYSKTNESAKVLFGEDKDNLTEFDGESGEVETDLTGGEQYYYNHVTATGLEENKTYYYSVVKDGEATEPVEYKTGSFSDVKMLFVGDPQIGASKGQPQMIALSEKPDNTAARNDAFAWNRTLNAAIAQNPDINFIISAGDQVNNTGNPKEEEFAGYLNAAVLQNHAEATTIGNHDSLNPDYGYHFFNPNATDKGATPAGGDYYYSYGPGLFIVLNTNNYNVAEHAEVIKEAVESDPDAKWRIVTIHQDIYGSGLDHSDSDGMILRTQLTPVFDENDIDVVLQGHDHTFSRSKILSGDNGEHGKYEFRLNEDGTDYDWAHAYNVDTDEQIPLVPEDGDDAGKELKDNFQKDNICYSIEDVEGNSVENPQGILYMESNSASGSKFYELIPTMQDYIAVRSQNWVPSFSVIDMTDTTFTISTYQVNADGQVESVLTQTSDGTVEGAESGTEETFTITKTE